jgi:hypothetical protein
MSFTTSPVKLKSTSMWDFPILKFIDPVVHRFEGVYGDDILITKRSRLQRKSPENPELQRP